MKIQCTECGFSADVDPKKLPANVKTVICPKCKCRFPFVQKPEPAKTIVCPRCNLRQTPADVCRQCQRPFARRPPVAAPSAPGRRPSQVTLAAPSRKGRVYTLLLVGAVLFAAGLFFLGGNDSAPSGEAFAPPTGQSDTSPTAARADPQTADLIRSVASGKRHTAVVRSDGTLWLWGNNESGQLGTGMLDKGTPVPEPLTSLGGFRAVAAGGDHTLGLLEDGSVWGWGENEEGQVGCNSEMTNVLRPSKVADLQNITAIAAGGSHSLALKADGTVWAWGDNVNNQLGTYGGDRLTRKPQQVPLITDITAIAAGKFHSLALDSSGYVYIWGGIFPAMPGKGNEVRRFAPTQVSGLPKMTAIAAGELDSLALTEDGSVWTLSGTHSFSAGEKAGMSVGEMQTAALKITAQKVLGLDAVQGIAAGAYSFHALKSDGTVWGWGSNGRGELAAFNGNSSDIPLQIIRYRQKTGTVTNVKDTLPLAEILLLAAGETTIFAVDGAGTLWTWGDNHYGQRGTSEGTKPVLPWPVSAETGITALNNVVVQSQGPAFAAAAPRDMAGLRPRHKIFAGGYQHSIFVKQDHTVWVWGNNKNHQLGPYLGTSRRIPVQTKNVELGPVIEVAADYYHSMALEQTGTVWVWGKNPYDPGEKSIPRKVMENVRSIAAGRNFNLALDSNGDVHSWGGRFDGTFRKGDERKFDVDPVRLPLVANITSVAAGYDHALALDQEGIVYAWGNNKYGQLGTGSNTRRLEPVPVAGLRDVVLIAAGRTISLALKKDGTVWAWGEGLAADFHGSRLLSSLTPVQMAGLDHVVAIACGGLISENLGHNMALKEDGTVWAWGSNFVGQLGDGTKGNSRNAPVQVVALNNVVAIAAGDQHSLALKADGHLYGWGNNMNYQAGAGIGMVTIPLAIEGL